MKLTLIARALALFFLLGAWLVIGSGRTTQALPGLARTAEAEPAGPLPDSDSVTARAAPLTIEPIDVPESVGTVAFGINDQGQIVGAYADKDHPDCVTTLIGCHGFLLSDGHFTTIDVPDARTTFAQGINDQGQVVGQYLDRQGANRGFLWKAGQFVPIDAPGAIVTGVNSINDSGQIVGIFDDGPDPSISRHGFLLENSVFTPIDFPDASSTSHVALNDSGQIVGVFLDTEGAFHGFRLDGDVYTQLDDFPGAVDTSAEGINDSGQIVGQFFVDRPGQPRGFLLDSGGFTPIDGPHAIYTIAEDINDSGRIVGQYQDAKGIHGFLATPAQTR